MYPEFVILTPLFEYPYPLIACCIPYLIGGSEFFIPWWCDSIIISSFNILVYRVIIIWNHPLISSYPMMILQIIN